MRLIAKNKSFALIAALTLFCSFQVNAQRAQLAIKLDSEIRSEADKARDEGRKPAQVLNFLGLNEGMTVLDVMAGGGWYTEVLSLAVGKEGKVIAHNTPAALQFRDGANEKAISERLADNRLPNVTRLNADFSDLGLENEVDLAISALNFHDLYNRDPEAAIEMLKAVKKALRPGGVLGLIDHSAGDNKDYAKLHRMREQEAIDAARVVGFEVGVSDILQNTQDDHARTVFDQEIRGYTDRFLLKLTKLPE